MPETEDDLWHLSKIIEKGDIVSGITSRKEKGKEGSATIRKTFLVELEVEKSTFDRFGKALRVSGKIIGGSASDLPFGSMQVIEIEPNKKYKIVKKALMKHHIERLKKAKNASRQEILLVVLDDEHATVALLRDFRYEIRAEIRSAKSGKIFEAEQWRKEYFGNIAKKILDYSIGNVIVAGPGFVKNEFAEFLREKGFKGKVFVEGISTTGLTGINELIKGPAIAKIAREAQIVEESNLIEKLLGEIAKDGLAIYGIAEVKKASESGAIETLLVLDKLLVEKREEIAEIIETSEKAQAKVHIFNSEYEPGKKLESLGGIAALLRYRLTC
ncbi:MAG: mRNA surveillance protein pelota [Candidatus Diapherotrites archaeon]|nr:mRNA surveillance protein pelota [Candidatus Diapherotrites archaeon]